MQHKKLKLAESQKRSAKTQKKLTSAKQKQREAEISIKEFKK